MQGMLAIGAALLGSPAVLGIEIDADALGVAQQNCEQFEDPLPVRVILVGMVDSRSCRDSTSDLGALSERG
jgi:predicted RNA methylase